MFSSWDAKESYDKINMIFTGKKFKVNTYIFKFVFSCDIK